MDFNRPNILILTGNSGSGKSTIAEHLEYHPDFGHLVSTVSFGYYLRSIVDQYMRLNGEDLPWDLHPLNRVRRDVWERESGYKDRMIDVGDQVIARHPMAFITPVIQEIEEMPHFARLVVCPDCRSPLELAALKSVGNVWGVKLIRTGTVVKKYDRLIGQDYPQINNNGTPIETIAQIASVLRDLPNA